MLAVLDSDTFLTDRPTGQYVDRGSGARFPLPLLNLIDAIAADLDNPDIIS
jgi:hypothetical protein